MTPTYWSTDELEDPQAIGQLEQQLRALRPSPVSLDAQRVLAAANQTRPSCAGIQSIPSTRRWLNIAITFASGCLVGAVATGLTWGRFNGRPSPVASQHRDHIAVRQPGSNTNSHQEASQHGPKEERSGDLPWSRVDPLAFAALLEAHGQPLTHTAPLQAGTYRRFLRPSAEKPTKPHLGGVRRLTHTRGTEGPLVQTAPLRSRDHLRILEELRAGSPPGWN